MSDRLLALMTAKLIDRCGGLQEASDACGQLARYYSVPQLVADNDAAEISGAA